MNLTSPKPRRSWCSKPRINWPKLKQSFLAYPEGHWIVDPKRAKFTFRQRSRGEALYTESGKSVSLEVEPMVNPMGLIVYLTGTTEWDDGMEMTDEELEHIKKNIQSLHDPNDWLISAQLHVI